jgi:CRISPR-associated protein Csx10
MRLIPEQPLVIENDHVINAQAVRGAIANVLLGTCKPGHEHDLGPCGAECRYWTLFGESVKLMIGAAYASNVDEVQPFLQTARTCAQVPGFKTAGGHGVFDIAIRQWMFEAASVDPLRMMAPFQARCPVCANDLMICSGFYTKLGEHEYALVGEVSTLVETNATSMNRVRKQVIKRHRSEARSIIRGIYFVARVDVPDAVDSLFKQAVAGGLMIGGQRSRGRGAVGVELIPYTGARIGLGERIGRFNRLLRAEQRYYAAMDTGQAGQTGQVVGDDGAWYFTLDLHNAVYPAYAEAPSIIPKLTAIPGVLAVRRWVRPEIMTGWHNAVGLARRTQIGAVGVVLFQVSAETNRLLVEELLAFLEDEGIGSGRERGFGTVTVCDPFHLNVEPL